MLQNQLQYNVEECYEKLKNGVDETMDVSDFNDSLPPNGTNIAHAHSNTVDTAWPSSHPQLAHLPYHPGSPLHSQQSNTDSGEAIVAKSEGIIY